MVGRWMMRRIWYCRYSVIGGEPWCGGLHYTKETFILSRLFSEPLSDILLLPWFRSSHRLSMPPTGRVRQDLESWRGAVNAHQLTKQAKHPHVAIIVTLSNPRANRDPVVR